MSGRNAKPVILQVMEGNPNNLTKAEIERRKAAEIKLGSDKLTMPAFIKDDPVAKKKWRDLVKEYKEAKELGIDLVTSTDTGLLARYCQTFSEYKALVKRRQAIDNIDILDTGELDILEKATDEQMAKKLFNKINYIISTEGILKMDTAINKKMDMLIKMEDRLFLNPLAKVKNIPKRPAKDTGDDPVAQNFGAI